MISVEDFQYFKIFLWKVKKKSNIKWSIWIYFFLGAVWGNCRAHSYTQSQAEIVNDGGIRPGKGVQVNLVRVDETHVFKHAEDALQTQTTPSVSSHWLQLSTCNLSLLTHRCWVLETLAVKPTLSYISWESAWGDQSTSIPMSTSRNQTCLLKIDVPVSGFMEHQSPQWALCQGTTFPILSGIPD